MVQSVLRTIENPLMLLFQVVDAPDMQVMVAVVAQRLLHMVLVTIEIPQLLDTVIDVPVVQFVVTMLCALCSLFVRRGWPRSLSTSGSGILWFLRACVWQSLVRCWSCLKSSYADFSG